MSASRPRSRDVTVRINPNDSVFGGSTQIGSAAVVEGETWEKPAEPVVSATEWFRRGWLALRDHHDEDAIAAFDRATDATVLEDASFWAAIAAERAGHPDARARFQHVLTAFPHSGHAAAASQHLRGL